MNLFNTEIPNLYKKNKIKCDLLLNFWPGSGGHFLMSQLLGNEVRHYDNNEFISKDTYFCQMDYEIWDNYDNLNNFFLKKKIREDHLKIMLDSSYYDLCVRKKSSIYLSHVFPYFLYNSFDCSFDKMIYLKSQKKDVWIIHWLLILKKFFISDYNVYYNNLSIFNRMPYMAFDNPLKINENQYNISNILEIEESFIKYFFSEIQNLNISFLKYNSLAYWSFMYYCIRHDKKITLFNLGLFLRDYFFDLNHDIIFYNSFNTDYMKKIEKFFKNKINNLIELDYYDFFINLNTDYFPKLDQNNILTYTKNNFNMILEMINILNIDYLNDKDIQILFILQKISKRLKI